jgi:hypothetical protein
MARVDVDGSTMSVMSTVVVDDGISVLSVIINDIDLCRVSLVVAIDNHSVTVSASLDHCISMSTSLDDRGIVSVTSSLDNGGIVMASGCEERSDLLHDRLSLVDSNQRSVSGVSVSIFNNHDLIVVMVM